MSYMMCSRITFPANKRREELVIYTISSIHIESSWKMLTDSAEIVLPRRIKYFAGKDLKELLSAGDLTGCVRAVVLTLAKLESGKTVQVTVEGSTPGEDQGGLFRPLGADSAWILE